MTHSKAYNKLEDRLVWRSPSRWDSPAPLSKLVEDDIPLLVVPFLIELLRYSEVTRQDSIMQLLADLANYIHRHGAFGDDIQRAQKIRDLVNTEVDLYKSFLKHPNFWVNSMAAELLDDLGVAYEKSSNPITVEAVLHQIIMTDWSNLGTPELAIVLRDLVSDNRDSRTKAYLWIDDTFFDAGADRPENFGPLSETLKTEAPIYVVPILIGFLQCAATDIKMTILEILSDFENMTSSQLKDAVEPYKTRAIRVRADIEAGIDVYRTLLKHEHMPIAMSAAQLLYALDRMYR